jgi:hypothetical protein
MSLIRFLISLAMFLAFIWFAVTVKLGKRTLWGHTYAIFSSQEAQDLAEGTKEEAEKVARRVKKEIHPPDMLHPPDMSPPPAPQPAHRPKSHKPTH